MSPVNAIMIDSDFVVISIINDSAANALGIKKGDVITNINGKRPIDMINEVRQYVPASNKITQTHYISDYILMGDNDASHQLRIKDKNGKIKHVVLPTSEKFASEYFTKFHGRFNQQMLRFATRDIGYADLDRLEPSQIDSMFDMFKNTKAIIFDMRGFPHVTGELIAARLARKKNTVVEKFTWLSPTSPNINPIDVEPLMEQKTTIIYKKLPLSTGWTYKGKTVLLINEYTQSQGKI